MPRGLPEAAVGEPRGALDQLDRNAAPRQRVRGRAAGDAAPDDQGGSGMAAGRCRRGRNRASRVGAQDALHHLALAAEPRRSLDRESRLLQPPPHPARAGVGRHGPGAARGARDVREHRIAPHLGILRRRESVEEPRVDDACRQLRQRFGDVADRQGEAHAPAGEAPAVPVRHAATPARKQRRGPRRQFRPQRQRRAQLVVIERRRLDAEEVEARPGGRVLLERLPRGEEIQAGAEARLADAEARPRRQRAESLGEPIAAQEHVPRLLQAGVRGEVHVAVPIGVRLSVFPAEHR